MDNGINMKYIDIAITVSIIDLDEAIAIADMVSPHGFSVEDYSQIEESIKKIPSALISSELKNKDKSCGTIHIYIEENNNPIMIKEEFSNLLFNAGIKHSVEMFSLEEKDYANSWKKYYKPTEIGKRLVVIPSWTKYDNTASRIEITLDPGMAFGTGTHETTILCMEYLEEVIGKTSKVLDVGTGSGILAITSVLLGAKSALGVDIDTVAVRVAKENALINNVKDKTEFFQGDLTTDVEGKYNVIIANIVADAVIMLGRDIKKHMSEDGVLIVSGIIDERKDEVIKKLLEYGFFVDSIKELKGWVAIKLLTE